MITDDTALILRFHARASCAGDRYAAKKLADLLTKQGDLNGAVELLRAPADAGDGTADSQSTDLLAGRGDLNELRARVDGGDRFAGVYLDIVLAQQGRHEEAERLRRFGLNADGSIAYA